LNTNIHTILTFTYIYRVRIRVFSYKITIKFPAKFQMYAPSLVQKWIDSSGALFICIILWDSKTLIYLVTLETKKLTQQESFSNALNLVNYFSMLTIAFHIKQTHLVCNTLSLLRHILTLGEKAPPLETHSSAPLHITK